MASFVLFMSAGQIAYSTITGYVWSVVDHHISNGYASPLANVRDWSHFMSAVQVETHVPAEPRRMFPWLLFIRALIKINLDDPVEVGMGLFMLILMYTLSRPELLPLALTGKHAFDGMKHLRWKDLRDINGYCECNLRGIKQDPLCKRAVAVAGAAWRAIGECTGILNFRTWYQRYLSMMKPTDENAPLLYNDRGKILTYAAGNRLLRKICARVNGCTIKDALMVALGQIQCLPQEPEKPAKPASPRR